MARWWLGLSLALAACSGGGDNRDDSDAGGGGAGNGGAEGGNGNAGSGGGVGGMGGETTMGTLGIVVIDVQETFVTGSSTPDMAGVIERTKSILELAGTNDVPVVISFEASQTGDHALHAPLEPSVPPAAQRFTKTTFDATGLAAFHDAVAASGVSHVAVLGAETDVCVMQSVLGLREMGLTVMLQTDAVFTSEPHTSPARRRMEQAGVAMIDLADVTTFTSGSGLPLPSRAAVRRAEPLQMGVVLNAFDAAALAAGDPLTSQKGARLRELLLVSEWFDLPVYAAAPIPAAYADYYQGTVRPLSQIATDGGVTQLTIAGSDDGLAAAVAGWSSHDLFLMEDALLAVAGGDHDALLQSLEQDGAIPTTYKSFYYEMTRSVDVQEWPSQTWIDRYDEYYRITQAPEDLPPMPAD
jgi:nicotinamidase-related amidase